MKITKYNLEICMSCFRFKGTVEEAWNGIVPVYCMCDVAKMKHLYRNPRILGGMTATGYVDLRFMACCDYRKENGEIWHVPGYAAFGMGRGIPEHLPGLIDFLKTNGCSQQLPDAELVNEVLNRAKAEREARKIKKEVDPPKPKDMIRICETHDLHSYPLETEEDIWVANCPTGAWHKIRIYPSSHRWECRRCLKSGDPDDLLYWIGSLNNRSSKPQ